MPITVPVPEEYAAKFDKKVPSNYDQYVAFTGPYMVKNDPKTGKVTGREPGKLIEIVRNPNWDKSTDYRPRTWTRSPSRRATTTWPPPRAAPCSGQTSVCCDAGSPPAQVLKQALQRNQDQVCFVPSGGTRYIAFNTKIKPFDNINVRKAIIAASTATPCV